MCIRDRFRRCGSDLCSAFSLAKKAPYCGYFTVRGFDGMSVGNCFIRAFLILRQNTAALFILSFKHSRRMTKTSFHISLRLLLRAGAAEQRVPDVITDAYQRRCYQADVDGLVHPKGSLAFLLGRLFSKNDKRRQLSHHLVGPVDVYKRQSYTWSTFGSERIVPLACWNSS